MASRVIKFANKVLKLLRIVRSKQYLSVLLKCGVAPVDEHVDVISKLHLKTVVDVGANRGQFALLIRNCYPDAEIFSFEPLAAPAEKYSCVFKDDIKTKLFKVAVGQTKETKSMHVSKSDDSSSLLPITSKQNELFPGTAEDHEETVSVDLLENNVSVDQVKSPSMLKIDVQGYELEVLSGSLTMLSCFDFIYVECSYVELYEGQALAHDVVSVLADNGFQIKGIYNTAYDAEGECIQSDFLFIRSN